MGVGTAHGMVTEESNALHSDAKTFTKLNVYQIDQLDRILKIPRSDDNPKFVKGTTDGHIQLIFDGRSFLNTTRDVPEDTPIGLLLDRTSFYSEQGGQVSDVGRIFIEGVAEFEVHDVQTYGGYILHSGLLRYGELSTGNEVICEIDEPKRQCISQNHTSAHILNHSLREVIGDDTHQKGSLVDSEKLRFAFSHKTALKIDELKEIERMSNTSVDNDFEVFVKDVDLGLARQIEGIRAGFGETYPDPARIVSIGMEIDAMLAEPRNPRWRGCSVEFCGGTHVDRTGVIKKIIIIEESGVAKGIRRIVAYTGATAAEAQRKAADMEQSIAKLEQLPFSSEKEQMFKQVTTGLAQLTISVITKHELKSRLDGIFVGIFAEQKKRLQAEHRVAMATVVEHFSKHEDSCVFVGRLPISANAKALVEVTNHFKANDAKKSVYVFGGSAKEGSAVHAVYVGEALSSKGVTAARWAESVCQVIGGKSGGKEPLLQGRGTDPHKLDEAVVAAATWLEEKLKI